MASANAREVRALRGAYFYIDASAFIHNQLVVDSLTVTFAALTDPTRRSILERLAGGPA